MDKQTLRYVVIKYHFGKKFLVKPLPLLRISCRQWTFRHRIYLPARLNHEYFPRQKGVHGVLMGSTNLKTDIPLYADLYAQGRMELDELVTQEINIADINKAYEQLKAGGIIRSVITSF